jgi:hypothetical protein
VRTFPLSVTPKAFTVSGRKGVGVTDSSVMASPFVQAARYPHATVDPF